MTKSSSALDGFGKANMNGSGSQYENWSLKPDAPPLILGIFPPMKDCQDTGEWALYWALHFGWKGRNSKDPTKLRHRPFLSLEESRFKDGQRQIIYQSAADSLVAEKIEERDNVKAQLKVDGLSDKEISVNPEYKRVASWVYNHSIDRKWRMLAYEPSTGKVGVLKLTNTAKKAVVELARELSQDGLSLIPSPENGFKGVLLSIHRTGIGLNTVDHIRAYEESEVVDGRKMKTIKEWELTEQIAGLALSSLPGLLELKETYRISPEKIQELIDSGDDPDEVDRILGEMSNNGRSNSKEESPAPKASASKKEASPAPKKEVVAKKEAPPKEEPAEAEEDEEDEDEALMKQMEALKAEMAKKKAAKAKAKAPPKEEKKSFLPEDSDANDELDDLFDEA